MSALMDRFTLLVHIYGLCLEDALDVLVIEVLAGRKV